MSKQPEKRKVPDGPATGYDPVLTLRVPKEMRDAVDAYAKSEGWGTRSVAIRAIMADWLRTHGFTVASGSKPVGPATDAVDAEAAAGKAAIAMVRKSLKRSDKLRSTPRMTSIS